MKFEIMVNILFEMLSKKIVSAKYLADKYEVSVRTVYRYIQSLEYAGIPVYTTRGNGGGFSLIDTYRLSASFLTKSEFEQTVSAITGILSGLPNKTLENALNKLKGTVKNEYSNYNITNGNLIIDAGPWGDAVGYKSKMSVIQKCIEDKLVLNIVYHDRNGNVTNRDIEPHIIVFKQGLWYVYSYCRLRQTFRFFKIGRIESANAREEKFARREIPDENLSLDIWSSNTLAEEVVMEISNSCLSDVEEWLGIENVKHVNGKNIATAKLPSDIGLTTKIMSYGSGIKVIKPQSLIESIKQVANAITKTYAN